METPLLPPKKDDTRVEGISTNHSHLLTHFASTLKPQTIQNKGLLLGTKVPRCNKGKRTHELTGTPAVNKFAFMFLHNYHDSLANDINYAYMKAQNSGRPERLIRRFPTSDVIIDSEPVCTRPRPQPLQLDDNQGTASFRHIFSFQVKTLSFLIHTHASSLSYTYTHSHTYNH